MVSKEFACGIPSTHVPVVMSARRASFLGNGGGSCGLAQWRQAAYPGARGKRMDAIRGEIGSPSALREKNSCSRIALIFAAPLGLSKLVAAGLRGRLRACRWPSLKPAHGRRSGFFLKPGEFVAKLLPRTWSKRGEKPNLLFSAEASRRLIL